MREPVLRTIAVIALKGGSGKTTVAAHIALAAFLRGHEVMVADTDPQRSIRDVLSMRAHAAPDVVATSGGGLLGVHFAAKGNDAKDLMVVDTAAGAVEDVGEAIVLADYVVLVVRPTMLDLSGLVRSLTIVRKLGKPYAVVMNQAPVPREGTEAPVVRRFLRGLEYMQAPVAPVILRARSVYQTALETGKSAEETADEAARAEVAALWDYVSAELWREQQDQAANG